jgi:hypothetical protein
MLSKKKQSTRQENQTHSHEHDLYTIYSKRRANYLGVEMKD